MTDMTQRAAGVASGMLGGLIAGVIFKQTWRLIAGKDDQPKASSDEYGWGEILLAAALQGAIFGAVKAALERTSYRTLGKRSPR